MANRYWVGGSGTWSTSSTANWSATSGGAAGASVPTASDDVFFDQAGTYTVTLQAGAALYCASFTCTSSSATFSSAYGVYLRIYGSFSTTSTSTFQCERVIFLGTGLVTTNNINFNGAVEFGDGVVSSSYELVGNLTTTGGVAVKSGIFSTSFSSYSVSTTSTLDFSASSKTVYLNNSNVTAYAVNINGSGFNAGFSQINITGNAATFSSSPVFYNVVYTGSGSSFVAINGAATYYNLTFLKLVSNGVKLVSIIGAQTVNGAFSSPYQNPFDRIFLYSITIGTPVSLILNGSASIEDVDFRDISVSGSIGTLAGTRLGDCLGNTGITFPAPKTVYYRNTASSNWGGISWSATLGGALDTTQFPLAQDTAIIPVGYPASGNTITMNSQYNIGSVDASARTSPSNLIYFNVPQSYVVYKDWVWGNGALPVGTPAATTTFAGRTTQTINCPTLTFGYVTINAVGGVINCASTISLSSTAVTISLQAGTLNLQNNQINCDGFLVQNSLAAAINFGASGSINVTGKNGYAYIGSFSNFTVSGSKQINIVSGATSTIQVQTNTIDPTQTLNFAFTTNVAVIFGGPAEIYGNLDCSAFPGELKTNGGTITGNLTLSSSMTLTQYNIYPINFVSYSGTKTITTSGKAIPFEMTFAGGDWQIQDNVSCQSTVNLNSGSIDLNLFSFGCVDFVSNTTDLRIIYFNGGTINVARNWIGSGGSVSSMPMYGPGVISMNSSSPKSFVGGGKSYPTLNNGGNGQLTITNSNSFISITNSVQPTSFLFSSGSTTTIDTFAVSGAVGQLVSVGATSSGSNAILRKNSAWEVGTNSVNVIGNVGLSFTAGGGIDYLSFSYITGQFQGYSDSNFFAFF